MTATAKCPPALSDLLDVPAGDPASLLRQVCDCMAEAVVIANAAGKVVLIGAAARRLFGLAADDPIPADWKALPGRYLGDGVTPVPSDRLLVSRALRGEYVDGEIFFFRNRGLADGVWANGSARPIPGADGKIAGCVVVWRDVTAQMYAERALRESEGRFHAIFNGITDAAVFADGRRRIVLTNPAFTTMFGYDAAAVRGRSAEFLYADPEDFHQNGERHQHAGDPVGGGAFEVRYRRRDGSVFWSETLSTRIEGADGAVIGHLGLHRDITSRKDAEAALQRINDTLEEQVAVRTAEAEARARALYESERFARATIDALSSTLCVVDEAGKIIAVNKAWREFAAANGARPDAVSEGADYLAVCDLAADACPTAAAIAGAIRGVVAGRRQTFALEYECHSPTERRWFVAKLTRFPGSGPVRLVVRHEDVTQRKLDVEEQQQSAERLKRLAAHLESVREEQSTTIAREVHDELGGTLTMLKLGLATTIESLPASAPELARFQGMLDQVDSAIQTVKRISASLRPAMLDTLGLIATIRWYAREFSRLTGVVTTVRMPEYIRLSAERSTAVFRIVQEGLTNIAKHSGASRASIAMRKYKGLLIVDLRDDGRGLSPDSLRKHDSFGLIGMHERAQYLGGRLSFAGTPTGTRLTLRIPLEG